MDATLTAMQKRLSFLSSEASGFSLDMYESPSLLLALHIYMYDCPFGHMGEHRK